MAGSHSHALTPSKEDDNDRPDNMANMCTIPVRKSLLYIEIKLRKCTDL